MVSYISTRLLSLGRVTLTTCSLSPASAVLTSLPRTQHTPASASQMVTREDRALTCSSSWRGAWNNMSAQISLDINADLSFVSPPCHSARPPGLCPRPRPLRSRTAQKRREVNLWGRHTGHQLVSEREQERASAEQNDQYNYQVRNSSEAISRFWCPWDRGQGNQQLDKIESRENNPPHLICN